MGHQTIIATPGIGIRVLPSESRHLNLSILQRHSCAHVKLNLLNWRVGASNSARLSRVHDPVSVSCQLQRNRRRQQRGCRDLVVVRRGHSAVSSSGQAAISPMLSQEDVSSTGSRALNKGGGQLDEVSGLAGGASEVGSFRGGQKRAEVIVPSLVIRITITEALHEETGSDVLDAAVAGGATIVVLEPGSVADVGGARLFEAACAVRGALRGRAQLLVAERADIAAAAEADGVLLSDQGLPAVVARRMMESAAIARSGVLPLVARTVASPEAAASAAAQDGADLLLLEPLGDSNASDLASAVCGQVSIPVVCQLAVPPGEQGNGVTTIVAGPMKAGASGVMLHLSELSPLTEGPIRSYVQSVVASMIAAQEEESEELQGVKEPETSQLEEFEQSGAEARSVTQGGAEIEAQLQEKALHIMEGERSLLQALLDLLQTASPQMAEISLLEDALIRLDDLFLLVIVGEFNSGKSSVLNALLGERFLREGILPTTNEITLLRHVDELQASGKSHGEHVERHPDGHFVRYLTAPLLKQMNLVDTPGTNVILERQQRLTEEFVPRADLVLFVLSADRPLTESEVEFLRYIRQWGKKVVFLLNKADLLAEESEVEEVLAFVHDNIQRLLGVEEARCFPLSARIALQAKLSATATSPSEASFRALLAKDARWQSSGFEGLERFIQGFLAGSTDAGAERLRLKLDTPLGVAAALLVACERQLAGEAEQASSDLRVLSEVRARVASTAGAMREETREQQRRVGALVRVAQERAEQFVDATLRLSNVRSMGHYLLSSTVGAPGAMPVAAAFQGQVIGATTGDVKRVLQEFQAWLASSTSRQLARVKSNAADRWPGLVSGERQDLAEMDIGSRTSTSVKVLEEFNPSAAALVLEEELRQSVVNAFGGFGAAGLSASVLTAVLPTTTEDLLALAACTAGGYVSALNVPQRREDVKAKIRRSAGALVSQLEAAMDEEAQVAQQRLESAAEEAMKPYQQSLETEEQRVAQLQARLALLSSKLRTLRLQVQNLGS